MALVLVCGLSGCSVLNPTPTTSVSPPMTTGQLANVPIRKAEDLPKHAPKAESCAAYGAFAAEEATAPGLNPVEVEEKRDLARKAYQQALSIDPKCLVAYQGLARLYIDMKDYRHATATYLEAQKKLPKESSLYYELGMCYGQQKDWNPAIQNLSKAVQLEPEKRLYNNVLGYALARCGRYDESLKTFMRLENEPEAHYRVAWMQWQVHQDDLARQHLIAALQVDPGMKPAQELLSTINGNGASAIQQANFVGTPPK
jgi:tetratricopeptide (TPR) repeat protein